MISAVDDVPHLSVVIPLFNKEALLARCLTSVLGQTFHDLEVIVVDDGSTDSGTTIVERIAAEDPRVRLLRENHGGPSAARNAGLRAATGTWVGFVDADDHIASNMYGSLLALVARDPEVIGARCGYVLDRSSGASTQRPSPVDAESPAPVVEHGGSLYRRLYEGPDISLMTVCTAVYRRELLDAEAIVFDEQLTHTEDALFNAEYYSLDRPIAISTAAMYYYHQSSDTQSHRYDPAIDASIDHLLVRTEQLEASDDAVRRRVALAGHTAFLRYLGLYYVIALADALAEAPDHAVFSERARRTRDCSSMRTVFERAKTEDVKLGWLGVVWSLLAADRLRALALLLRGFNAARTIRRRSAPWRLLSVLQCAT